MPLSWKATLPNSEILDKDYFLLKKQQRRYRKALALALASTSQSMSQSRKDTHLILDSLRQESCLWETNGSNLSVSGFILQETQIDSKIYKYSTEKENGCEIKTYSSINAAQRMVYLSYYNLYPKESFRPVKSRRGVWDTHTH